jgi:hypothetical protein
MKVYGYQRSGNNLLAAALWLNFKMDAPVTDIRGVTHAARFDKQPQYLIDGCRATHLPWGHLLTDHAPFIRQPLGDAIYIYRSDFEKVRASKERLFGRQNIPQETFDRQLWQDHIAGWKRSGCFTVEYGALVNNFQATMAAIAKRFRLQPVFGTFQMPPKLGWENAEPADPVALGVFIRRRFYKLEGDDAATTAHLALEELPAA